LEKIGSRDWSLGPFGRAIADESGLELNRGATLMLIRMAPWDR
jgi:hypothetical protein